MLIGEPLFRQGDLGEYLRQQVAAIEPYVSKNVTSSDLERSDVEIAEALLREAKIDPLVIDFDNPSRNVEEARVRVHDMFDGVVEIDGVRATKAFRFTGESDLFRFRPNRWSNSPHGVIRNGQVVIGIEGRNDADAIKGEIDRQESSLREHAENSSAQVAEHNAALEQQLIEAVARRRDRLGGIEKLRDAF